MQQWVIEANKQGRDALALREVDVPNPGPGQIRVAVKAVSLNYRDQIILNGDFGQAITEDTIPVSDAAGVVDAIGADVTEWAVGDRVITTYFDGWVDGPPPTGMGFGIGSPGQQGVLAEYIVLPARHVVSMPTTLDFVQAATLTCAGLTAWTAMMEEHPVTAGQTVLTLGTGGVALFAAQFAKALGARVVATTGRSEKVDRLLALGASRVLNYRDDSNWGATVYGETGGADKIVNAAGGDAMTQSFMAVAAGGEIAVMGLFSAGDAAPPLPVLMSKGASVRGTAVGSSSALSELVRFVDKHGIKPVVQAQFSLADARDAYAAQASPDVFGKIVITVAT